MIVQFYKTKFGVVCYKSMNNWNIMYFVNVFFHKNLIYNREYPRLYCRRDTKPNRMKRMANFCKGVCNKVHSGIRALLGMPSQWAGFDWKPFSLCGMGIWLQQVAFLKNFTFLMNKSCSFQFQHNVRYIFYVSSVKPWHVVQPQTIQHMPGQ